MSTSGAGATTCRGYDSYNSYIIIAIIAVIAVIAVIAIIAIIAIIAMIAIIAIIAIIALIAVTAISDARLFARGSALVGRLVCATGCRVVRRRVADPPSVHVGLSRLKELQSVLLKLRIPLVDMR